MVVDSASARRVAVQVPARRPRALPAPLLRPVLPALPWVQRLPVAPVQVLPWVAWVVPAVPVVLPAPARAVAEWVVPAVPVLPAVHARLRLPSPR